MAEITLTPEEEAQLTPVEINPLRDFNAQEIADLAVADKDNFDIATEFARQPDLHGDQALVQKTADALHLIRQRGFQLSDLPSIPKVAETAVGIVKGFGKQALNYLTAGVNVATGMGAQLFGDQATAEELAQDAQRRVAENIAGTEAAGTGLVEMAERGVKTALRQPAIAAALPGMVAVTAARGGEPLVKPLEQFTPEEKVKELFDAAGRVQVQQDIGTGRGAFMQAVGGNVIQELEEAGKPVRPEEVAQLAAGDPLTWWAFGKGLGQTGRLIPRVPPKVAGVVERAATVIGGKTLEALGKTASGIAHAARAATAVVPSLLLPRAATVLPRAGVRTGRAVAQVGRDIAAPGAATGAAAQLGRDVIQAIPDVVKGVAHGAAMDIGLAAVTSETPAETQGVGLGAVLGGVGGAQRAGQRILSGQIIAPRPWGSQRQIQSSQQFPTLDAMHNVAYTAAEPAVQHRLNAIREFVNNAAPGTDVYMARDAESIRSALVNHGVNDAQARDLAAQEGFISTGLPSPSGGQRRVVILRDVDAAPHEAFHAIQDVLGDRANRQIDELVRQTYADRWEAEGNRYSRQLTGSETANWRDAILDFTGAGHRAAVEKLSQAAGNQIRNATGAEPDPAAVRDLVRGAWEQARQTGGDEVSAWREILTPEEANQTADRYLARELAAENFDAAFNRLGPSLEDNSLTGNLARIVGQVVRTFGGEPLSPRASEFQGVPLRAPVVEAVTRAGRESRPVIEPAAPSAPTPRPTAPTLPRSSQDPATRAKEARTLAEAAPDTIVAGGTRSPREILGTVAEAIAQQSGVKLNYLSAPNEPAAAITSNRAARREIIEAFRTMPAAAKSLWEKNFFPERVFKLKGDKYQVFGWSPEVFAANAHKMAKALKDNPTLAPYEITGDSFSEAGWRELFNDAQTFVRNQMAGQTGAGERLVVPEDVTARGFFAPPARAAEAAPLPQAKADFVNLLFGGKIPETPRLVRGKPSLQLAAQEVSAATLPGRLEQPITPRERFAGEEAEAQGVAGREILEVNPVRSEIARTLGDKMPSLIEANQRLNLESIKEIEITPEQPQFRANTLTLAAGFQPTREEQQLARTGRGSGLAVPPLPRETPRVKEAADALIALDGPRWQEATQYNGQFGVGFTGWAYEIGSQARTSADLQNLRAASNALTESGRAALAAKDLSTANQYIYRAQAAREAYEAATGETLDGSREATVPFMKKYLDPNYEPPMPGDAYRRWKASQAEPAQPRRIPSDEDVTNALSEDKKAFVGAHRELPEGTEVGVRIDIPAYNRSGTFVQTVHEKASGGRVGKRLGYDSVVTLDDPTFFSNESGAVKIKEGAPKFPVATVEGRYNPSRELPTDLTEWTEVGYNPKRHSYFYEKSTEEPVLSGSTAVSVGNSVFVKDAVFGDRENFQFQPRRAAREEKPTVFDEELAKVRSGDSFGQTFTPSGEVWTASEPSDIVSLVSVNVPRAELTPERFNEALAPYRKLLTDPSIVTGVFSFEQGETPMVSIDINAVVPKQFRENTLKFAKDNDQIAIWDAEKSETVNAGGKGETRLNDVNDFVSVVKSLRKGKSVDLDALLSSTGENLQLEERTPATKKELTAMSRAELEQYYPEAVVPEKRDEPIPSRILESPLAKRAGSEEAAVEAFAMRLVEFARERQNAPEFKLGQDWYSDFAPKLKAEFGENAQLMAEMLAATSPQTLVEANFHYALDAVDSFRAGRFNKIIKKFEQGLAMMENGKWKPWIDKEIADGKVPKPPKKITPATFLAHWVETNNLKPKQYNGKLYGQHSLPVLQVLTRRWLDSSKGPKTKNFVENLVGSSHEATIDLWADRTMRRLGYADFQPRWRILPKNIQAVTDADFAFSQKAFRRAADQLGMKPDALQAALWFAEKQLWHDQGWSPLSLGDFRRELQKIPALRARRPVDKSRRSAKVEQPELEIEPRSGEQ